jgi:hypothetical protein
MGDRVLKKDILYNVDKVVMRPYSIAAMAWHKGLQVRITKAFLLLKVKRKLGHVSAKIIQKYIAGIE